MPDASSVPRVVIDGRASELASRIGRKVSALILERAAMKASRNSEGGSTIIHLDDVRDSFVDCLPPEVRERIGDLIDVDRRSETARSLSA